MSGVRTIGPYRVERKLGAGGMGAVFEVVHSTLGARYALKAYLGGPIDAQQLARFEREIQALGAIKHPNLVQIHTAGHDNGRPYYVMDLVEGEDLQQRLAKGGPFAARDAVAIVRDVALAVAALHERGIVHRDIKPANVIVTHEGRVLLTDLGVAKILSDAERERLTRTGELVGTPAYMAPEQALGLPEAGAPVDVWALGMLLYTLLAGRTALKPGNALALLQQVAQGLVIPLPESAPDVPREVCILVASALRREAADRPDAATWAKALDAWLRGETPPSHEALAEAKPERSRLAVGLALLGLLVAGGGLGWALTRRPPQPIEPIAQRAQQACQAGLAALTSGSDAPLDSAALAAIGSELEAAIAAGGQDVRELQGTRALLLLLEAEAALQRREDATVAALISRVPVDGAIARERLDEVRALRAAVVSGTDAAPDAVSLDQAVGLWPRWAALRARRIRGTTDPRNAIEDAKALLSIPGVDLATRREAAETLSAAEAWEALEPYVEGLGEPWRSRLLARRALASLQRSPMDAARSLAKGLQLALDDPVRAQLVTGLQRFIASSSHVQSGPDTVELRRREGWAHLALHHVDPAHRLPRDRADAMVALPFDLGITNKENFVGDDFDLIVSLVPLFEGERRGNMSVTTMFAANELWIELPPERRERAAQLCLEGYAYCRSYPHLVPASSERLASMLLKLKRTRELEELARDAPSLLENEDEQRTLRSALLTHLGNALGEPEYEKALAALDSALDLDPENHDARAARAALRNHRWTITKDFAHLAAVLEDLEARLRRPGIIGGEDLIARGEMANDSEWACNIALHLGQPARAIEILSFQQRGKGFGPQALHWLVLRITAGTGPKDDAEMLGALDDLESRLRWDQSLHARARVEGPQARNVAIASLWLGKFLEGLPAIREALKSGGVAAAAHTLLMHRHTVETERAKANQARNAQSDQEKAAKQEQQRAEKRE